MKEDYCQYNLIKKSSEYRNTLRIYAEGHLHDLLIL